MKEIDKIKQQTEVFQKVLKEIPEITYAGNSILREPTKEVAVEEGLHIAQNLENALLHYRKLTGFGRGLAAPQIGENKSVFITYVDDQIEVFINPKIIEKSPETNSYKELCVSAGVIAADIERSQWIIMEWTDKNSVKQSGRFDGLKARLLQHEEAHLHGRLNLDEAAPGCIQFVTFDPLQEPLRENL